VHDLVGRFLCMTWLGGSCAGFGWEVLVQDVGGRLLCMTWMGEFYA